MAAQSSTPTASFSDSNSESSLEPISSLAQGDGTADQSTTISGLALQFRKIDPTDTVQLRHLVLWPDKPLEEQLAAYDHYPTTIHLGAFLSQQYDAQHLTSSSSPSSFSPSASHGEGSIAVLTLLFAPYPSPSDLPLNIQEKLELPSDTQQVQLRKFAVHPSYQGHGVGTALFAHVLHRLRTSRHQADGKDGDEEAQTFLYLDARAHQVGFYTRLGMVVLSEPFVKYARASGESSPPAKYVTMGMMV